MDAHATGHQVGINRIGISQSDANQLRNDQSNLIQSNNEQQNNDQPNVNQFLNQPNSDQSNFLQSNNEQPNTNPLNINQPQTNHFLNPPNLNQPNTNEFSNQQTINQPNLNPLHPDQPIINQTPLSSLLPHTDAFPPNPATLHPLLDPRTHFDPLGHRSSRPHFSHHRILPLLHDHFPHLHVTPALPSNLASSSQCRNANRSRWREKRFPSNRWATTAWCITRTVMAGNATETTAT